MFIIYFYRPFSNSQNHQSATHITMIFHVFLCYIYIYIHTYMSNIFLYNRFTDYIPKRLYSYISIYTDISIDYIPIISLLYSYIYSYVYRICPSLASSGPGRRFFRLIFGMFQTMDSCLRESFGAWREDQWLRPMGILMVPVKFNIVIIVNGNINGHNNQSYE